jgi:hypothetical protein
MTVYSRNIWERDLEARTEYVLHQRSSAGIGSTSTKVLCQKKTPRDVSQDEEIENGQDISIANHKSVLLLLEEEEPADPFCNHNTSTLH